MVMIGILPTLADRPHEPRHAERQPALPAAERADPRTPAARTSDHRHRRPRAAATPPPTRSCPRRRAPAPSSTCRPRPEQFAAYWNASQAIAGGPARGRRQLAVPARQGAVARDPDPAVRAGHRHPQRGAQGAGRAAAGVVRRALDQLGLRPVRGERPLLPGAAADHRRRGPGRGARGRAARPTLCRAAAAQRHDLPLEPAGLRHRRRRAAPARREPRAAGRPDRRRH